MKRSKIAKAGITVLGLAQAAHAEAPVTETCKYGKYVIDRMFVDGKVDPGSTSIGSTIKLAKGVELYRDIRVFYNTVFSTTSPLKIGDVNIAAGSMLVDSNTRYGQLACFVNLDHICLMGNQLSRTYDRVLILKPNFNSADLAVNQLPQTVSIRNTDILLGNKFAARIVVKSATLHRLSFYVFAGLKDTYILDERTITIPKSGIVTIAGTQFSVQAGQATVIAQPPVKTSLRCDGTRIAMDKRSHPIRRIGYKVRMEIEID